MPYSDILKTYFPPIVTDSFINNQIINVIGTEFDTQDSKKADLVLQFDVDTATWALDYYEKDVGIVTDHNKSLSDRRSVIKSKWRGSNGKFTSTLIKIICDSFVNGNANVTYDGIIHIEFTSFLGIPPNINDLKSAVEQIKPAHILVDYEFNHNTWQYIKQFTWEDLKKYTWEDVLNSTIIPAPRTLYSKSDSGNYTEMEFK